jgi:DUF1365 family protein
MESSLYFGEVRHQRKSPKKHAFRYRVFMAHLFLDELREVFKGRLFWSLDRFNLSSFHRKDYHSPEKKDLADAVRSTMTKQLGYEVKGPVSIVTHLRTFGYCFNPVSFYYCWDEEKSSPHALMAEITNTPWHERYAKCFRWDENNQKKSGHSFEKEFHVSPFIGMEVDYDWRFLAPSDKLKVDMILREKEKTFFTAHLNLGRKTLNSFNMAWALIRFPLLTFRITFGIYWHALLLRLKGCRFYPHPQSTTS